MRSELINILPANYSSTTYISESERITANLEASITENEQEYHLLGQSTKTYNRWQRFSLSVQLLNKSIWSLGKTLSSEETKQDLNSIWFGKEVVAIYHPSSSFTEELLKKGIECFRNKKYEKAAQCLERLANEDNPIAINNLGLVYLRLKDQEGNFQYTKAMECFKKAVELGKEQAAINIGLMYKIGLGVEQSPSEAKKYFTIAKNAGHAIAEKHLKLSDEC
jgi:TPR repeat protein